MPAFKHDATGRSTHVLARSRDQKKLNTWDDGPFVQIGLELFVSPAWTCLNFAARMVLDRLLIEHMRHAGKENGKLPCTYDDFERYGVRRKSITKAIDALEAVGLIKRTRIGHLRPEGMSGAPSLYEITFCHTLRGYELVAATHDWRRIKSEEEALEKIAKFRTNNTARRKAILERRKTGRLRRTLGNGNATNLGKIQNSSGNSATT